MIQGIFHLYFPLAIAMIFNFYQFFVKMEKGLRDGLRDALQANQPALEPLGGVDIGFIFVMDRYLAVILFLDLLHLVHVVGIFYQERHQVVRDDYPLGDLHAALAVVPEGEVLAGVLDVSVVLVVSLAVASGRLGARVGSWREVTGDALV